MAAQLESLAAAPLPHAPQAAAGPLAGLLVVDWTHVLAGPFTTYQLGLLGARVIRIEPVQGTDIIRAASADPRRASLEMGDAFVMQSAGKESVAVDARDPEVRAALHKLIGRADVLVENFRPGKLAQLGFAPHLLIDQYPQLIVCSVSGFGQCGPDAQRPAYDHVVQATSGLMSANRDEQGRPQRVGVPLIDYATGMQAALAILAALHRRNRDEQWGKPRTRGEWLDVAMRDTALTLLAPAYASNAVSGVDQPRSRATAFSGNPLSGTFASADGYVAIVCNTARQDQALLGALANADLAGYEPQALARDVAARNVERVHACLATLMAQRPTRYWETHLIDHDVPVSPVLSPAESYARAAADPAGWPRVQVAGLATREVAVPGPGFRSTNPLTSELLAPPLRGEHTRNVLRSVGLDGDTVERLCAAGAAHQAAPRPQP